MEVLNKSQLDNLIKFLWKIQITDDGFVLSFVFPNTSRIEFSDSRHFRVLDTITGAGCHGVSILVLDKEIGVYFNDNWDCNYKFDERTITQPASPPQ